MAGHFIVGTLAAFGALCALWALLGWLLPGGKGCAVVCWGVPDEGIRSRYKWLAGAGLLNCPLLAVVPEGTDAGDPAESCTGEQLLSRLEWERKRSDGSGNGNHTGRHKRRGISEL